MLKQLLSFICLVICLSHAAAQQQLADSIEKVLTTSLTDSARAKALLFRGMYYEKVDAAKAHQCYKESLDFATAKKLVLYISKSHFFNGYFYNLEGNYTASIDELNKAIAAIDDKNNPAYRKDYLKELATLSGSYDGLGNVKKCIELNHTIISIKEKAGISIPRDYSNLAQVYQKMNDTAEEKKWFFKALDLAKAHHNEVELFQTSLAVSMYFTQVSQFEMSKKYVDSARFVHYVSYETVAQKENPDMAYYTYQVYYLITADAFQNLKQYDSALYFYQKAYDFAVQNKVTRDYIEPELKSGFINLLQKKYGPAAFYLEKALGDAIASKNMKQTEEAHESLSTLYAETSQFEKAYTHYKAFHALHDSISGIENKKFAGELEAKYETEKKDTEIRLQQTELKQKNTLNFVFAGAALSLLLIVVLVVLNYRKKQTIQQQTINELETEKKLTATKSLLEGEEKERSRIAKDLHDGLSGMLSGVKYSLQDMQGNLLMTPGLQQSFARSLDMLDSSIAEMRRVAHNMMPEVLLRFGLDAALKDYTTEVNKSGLVQFVYQSMGLEQLAVDQNTSLSIYRIVQELINNVIKHSGASKALVQVLQEEKKLVISVEDNGKGMQAPAGNDIPAGMGWKNIRSRVELLKGKTDVHSSPENGTVVNLEFTLS